MPQSVVVQNATIVRPDRLLKLNHLLVLCALQDLMQKRVISIVIYVVRELIHYVIHLVVQSDQLGHIHQAIHHIVLNVQLEHIH